MILLDRKPASSRCRRVILAASNNRGCGSWVSVRSSKRLGNVKAGVQGREIAAKTWKAFDGSRLGQEVERLGRFRKEHDIGNTQEVKSTLERRLEPARAFGQNRDLAKIAREKSRDEACLEDVDRPQDQSGGSVCRHVRSRSLV